MTMPTWRSLLVPITVSSRSKLLSFLLLFSFFALGVDGYDEFKYCCSTLYDARCPPYSSLMQFGIAPSNGPGRKTKRQ